jgi:hypothetical protein
MRLCKENGVGIGRRGEVSDVVGEMRECKR